MEDFSESGQHQTRSGSKYPSRKKVESKVKCKVKLKIPYLWKRKMNKMNQIYYVSPSGHILSSRKELTKYLAEPNTCKCYLQNLDYDEVFDFDPALPSEQLNNNDERLSLCEDWAQSIGGDFFKCQMLLTSTYLMDDAVFDMHEIYRIVNQEKEPVPSTSKQEAGDDFQLWLRYYDFTNTLVTKSGLVIEHRLSAERLKHLAYELTVIGVIGINENVVCDKTQSFNEELSDDEELDQLKCLIQNGKFDSEPAKEWQSPEPETKTFSLITSIQTSPNNEVKDSKMVLLHKIDNQVLDCYCKKANFNSETSSYQLRIPASSDGGEQNCPTHEIEYITFDPEFLKFVKDIQRIDIGEGNICEQQETVVKDDLNLNSTLIEDEDADCYVENGIEDPGPIGAEENSFDGQVVINIHQTEDLHHLPESVHLQDIHNLSPINSDPQGSIQLLYKNSGDFEFQDNITTTTSLKKEMSFENAIDLNYNSDDSNLSTSSTSSSTISIDSFTSAALLKLSPGAAESNSYDYSSASLNTPSTNKLRRRSASLDELRRGALLDSSQNGSSHHLIEFSDNMSLAEVRSRERYFKRLKRLKRELEIQGMPGNELNDEKVRLSPPLPPQERVFSVGDIVWGQREDVRFWPGKLVSLEEVGEGLDNLQQMKDKVRVRLCG